MESLLNKSKKILFLIVFILGIAINSYAIGNNQFTKDLKKGDILSFTENGATAWNVYKNKKDALKTVADKSVKAVKYLKTNDKIKVNLVSTKYENVLGIDLIRDGKTTKKYGYIHYGSNAADFFKKVNNNGQTKTTIKLNSTSLMLGPGEKYKLKATVKPAGTKVTWKSSNTNFAKVDKNGNITINNKEILNSNSIELGDKVTITAKAGDAVATCEITRVLVSVGKSRVGDSFDYTYNEGFDKIVKNENPNILEVQKDGSKVKFLKSGKAKLTWLKKDGTYCRTVWYVQTKQNNCAFFKGKVYEVNKGIYCDAYTKHANSEIDSGDHYWHLREGDMFQVIGMEANWVKVKIVGVTEESKKYFKEGDKYYIFVSDNTNDMYFTNRYWEEI